MRNVIGKYQAAVVVLYLLGWLLPGLLYLYVDWGSWNKLLFTMVFVCAWHLAFADFLRSVYYSLFFYLLLPFDLFFFYIYREPPGTAVLLSIGDSNMVEAADFMRGRGLVLFLLAALAMSVWLLTVKAAQHGMGREWKLYNKKSRLYSRIFVCWLAGCWIVFTTAPLLERMLTGAAHEWVTLVSTRFDHMVGSPLGKLRPSFPVGRLVSLGDYYRELAYLRDAAENKARFRYNARQAVVPAARQVYVLVIGETARADRFSLNGYARAQSPFLANIDNVIPLTNIVSAWSFTKGAVPAMLTPALSSAHGKRQYAKSLVSAFREAGFRSYWISNQLPMGMRETEISHYAREADKAVFLNQSMRLERQPGLYDGNLLAPFRQLLSTKEEKQFFVLHLLGAHDAYEKRYPPEFDFFKPSLLSLHNPDYHDRRNKREVNNSYDNAMRYTDYVLSRLIEAIKQEHAVATLVYSADHGETLFDGECHRSGHGSAAKQEFPIAAMVWVSDEYKQQWPDKLRHLRAHAAKPITAQSILPTALDLAAIDSDYLDPNLSLANPAFKAGKRWVNSSGLVDWDASTTKGPCSIVVPK